MRSTTAIRRSTSPESYTPKTSVSCLSYRSQSTKTGYIIQCTITTCSGFHQLSLVVPSMQDRPRERFDPQQSQHTHRLWRKPLSLWLIYECKCSHKIAHYCKILLLFTIVCILHENNHNVSMYTLLQNTTLYNKTSHLWIPLPGRHI
jgi:hypothetical protein